MIIFPRYCNMLARVPVILKARVRLEITVQAPSGNHMARQQGGDLWVPSCWCPLALKAFLHQSVLFKHERGRLGWPWTLKAFPNLSMLANMKTRMRQPWSWSLDDQTPIPRIDKMEGVCRVGVRFWTGITRSLKLKANIKLNSLCTYSVINEFPFQIHFSSFQCRLLLWC